MGPVMGTLRGVVTSFRFVRSSLRECRGSGTHRSVALTLLSCGLIRLEGRAGWAIKTNASLGSTRTIKLRRDRWARGAMRLET